MDYTTYVKIICDYFSIIANIFCKNLNDYSTLLLHYYHQKDDYFTYCTTIVSLIVFGIYYGDYFYYLTIIRIIGIIAIIYLYPHLHIKVVYGFRFHLES
jgi:hypothetical protein